MKLAVLTCNRVMTIHKRISTISIEWRALVNNRCVARDTEEDLILKPSSYWQQIKEKVDQAVRHGNASNRHVRSDETTVVVSVNEGCERDLTKWFETDHIDRTAVDRPKVGTTILQGRKAETFYNHQASRG